MTTNPSFPTSEDAPICLSHSETCRVQQALYRFETYCNPFRRQSNDSKNQFRPNRDRRLELLCDKFAYWEIEQLGSVYKHLLATIVSPFKDVAEHDVKWGENQVPYQGVDPYLVNDYKEHCLSLGFCYPKSLAVAETFDERYELPKDHMVQDSEFLSSLICGDGDYRRDQVYLCDLDEKHRKKILNHSFSHDPDPGPRSAWAWAYGKIYLDVPYYANQTYLLRRGGYVFLDNERLCKSGILVKTSWRNWYRPTKERLEEMQVEYEQMEESWEERSKLWQEGYISWYSRGDRSRLVRAHRH